MDMPIIAVVLIVLIALVALVVYFDIKKKSNEPEASTTDVSRVEITDVKMPFGSMVVFMVKWAIASIPAIIILWMLFMMFGGVLTGLTQI
jgi:hypothetical protein